MLMTLAAGMLLAGCGDKPGPKAAATPAKNTAERAPAVVVKEPAPSKPVPTELRPAEEMTPDKIAELTAAAAPRRESTTPGDSKLPTELKAAEAKAGPLNDSTLSVEPTPLDLGSVATGKYASGTVTLRNTGEESVTITQCKTSCGCTSTNCPKGEQIEPGESTEVDIRVTAGSRARTIRKTVTFLVEGQRPVTLPVSVDVIAYVTIDPQTIDPEKQTDGRMVIRSTDDQPFSILNMTPSIIEEFDPDPKVEHELFLSWDKWTELGKTRRLVFNIDHPEVNQVSALVRYRAPVAQAPNMDNPLARERQRLRDQGVVDAPLTAPEGTARLRVAIRNGDVEKISEALAEGLEQQDRDELLGLASRYGSPEIIATLLDGGADPNAKDKFGRTALISSIQSRNPEVIEMLIARGADVNARDQQQSTALLYAAGAFGNPTILKGVLAGGADVNASDANGQTALIWAARWGDAARVHQLVDAGADASVRDKSGNTALDYARQRADKSAQQMESILKPLTESKAAGKPASEPGVH